MTGYDNTHVRFWFADKQHFGDRLSLSKPKDSGGGETKKAREVPGQEKHSQAVTESTATVAETTKPLKPLSFFLRLEKEHRYLAERGVTAAAIERYGIGYCHKGLLRGYIAMPLYRHPKESATENPVAYVGRWAGEDWEQANQPRYKMPEGFEKLRVLFGLQQAVEDNGDTPLIVVESPFSVLALHQAGLGSGVATLGSSLSEEQAALLIDSGKRVCVAFDGDEAGRAGAEQGVNLIAQGQYVRQVSLPSGKSPHDLAADELHELFASF